MVHVVREVTPSNFEDMIRIINNNTANPITYTVGSDRVSINGNGGGFLVVKATNVKYDAIIEVKVGNISGNCMALWLNSGYYPISIDSIKKLAFRVILILVDNEIQTIKCSNGTDTVLDTQSHTFTSDIYYLQIIIDYVGKKVTFRVLDSSRSVIYTYTIDSSTDSDILKPMAVALGVCADTSFDLYYIKVTRTDIDSIIDFIKEASNPRGVLTVDGDPDSSYTVSDDVFPEWVGNNDIVIIPLVDETELSNVVSEIKSRGDWKKVILNWDGTDFYETPSYVAALRTLALLEIAKRSGDSDVLNIALSAIDAIVPEDGFVEMGIDKTGTPYNTGNRWFVIQCLWSAVCTKAYEVSKDMKYLNRAKHLILDWPHRSNGLPYDKEGDDSWGTRFDVAMGVGMLALALIYYVSGDSEAYNKLIEYVDLFKSIYWDDSVGWKYRDNRSDSVHGFTLVDPVCVFVGLLIGDDDLINKAVNDYKIKTKDRDNSTAGLSIDGMVAHEHSTYYDITPIWNAWNKLLNEVMKAHSDTVAELVTPLDCQWNKYGFHGTGYPENCPGEVSSRWVGYQRIQTPLLALPSLKEYNYDGTLQSFVENFGYILIPQVTLEQARMFAITDYPSSVSVTAGGVFTVNVKVKNEGAGTGSGTVRLVDHGGNVVDAVDVTLDAGAETSVTLSATAPSSPGTYTWKVEVYNKDTGSVDDSKDITLNVSSPAYQYLGDILAALLQILPYLIILMVFIMLISAFITALR